MKTFVSYALVLLAVAVAAETDKYSRFSVKISDDVPAQDCNATLVNMQVKTSHFLRLY